MDTRRLLNECADIFIVCDDGVRIPCSRFHVSTRCAILHWVTEDTTVGREIPFPSIPSKTLQRALDIVHDIVSLDECTLEDINEASVGFDVLGCTIEMAPRIWDLVGPGSNAKIETLRPYLSNLVRSVKVGREGVVRHAITIAPLFDDVMLTIEAACPDLELGIYFARSLARMYPVSPLVKHIVKLIPTATLDEAMSVCSCCDSAGTYIHPHETETIMACLSDRYHETNTPVWAFLKAMSGAMQCYDVAPLSCSTLHGSILSYHDSRITSTMLYLDGLPPRRRIVISKFLKFSMENKAVAVVWAHGIDRASKLARHLDVRMFAQTATRHAEIWYSWRAPTWNPTMDVSTDESCPKITGDRRAFDEVVDAGKFARRMTIRIDLFYGSFSALEKPPIF